MPNIANFSTRIFFFFHDYSGQLGCHNLCSNSPHSNMHLQCGWGCPFPPPRREVQSHTHTHKTLQVSPGHQEDSCTGKKQALSLRGPAEPERECSSDQKVSTAREAGVHQGASSQLPCTTPHPHPRPRAGSSTCHGGRIYSRPSLRLTCDREDAQHHPTAHLRAERAASLDLLGRVAGAVLPAAPHRSLRWDQQRAERQATLGRSGKTRGAVGAAARSGLRLPSPG